MAIITQNNALVDAKAMAWQNTTDDANVKEIPLSEYNKIKAKKEAVRDDSKLTEGEEGKLISESSTTSLENRSSDYDNPEMHMKNPMTHTYPSLDHQNFKASELSMLIPIAMSKIAIIKRPKPITSSEILVEAQHFGFETIDAIFNVFSRTAIGATRRLNNSELVAGYPMISPTKAPLSQKLNDFTQVRRDVFAFIEEAMDEIKNKFKHSQAIIDDEIEDFRKTTVLRTKYLGRHLQPPANLKIKRPVPPKRFYDILNAVIKHYAGTVKADLPSRREAMESFVDAPETFLGGPTFATGAIDDQSHDYVVKRLFTALDCPVPDPDNEPPVQYLERLYAWGVSLGIPVPEMTFAPMVSYRRGAKGHKPQDAWFFNGYEYESTHEIESAYANERLVFMAAWVWNLIKSAASYVLKSFRKKKVGMYHSPDRAAVYIPKLQAQGTKSYESDFSNYDLTIPNFLMVHTMRQFAMEVPQFAWEFELTALWLENTGVIYPSYSSQEPGAITFFKGPVGLVSGDILTSEIGSVLSIASNLYALEKWIPNVVNDWISNKFVALVQSDDFLTTTNVIIDSEEYTTRMAEVGFVAKWKPGMMFLKKLLPVGDMQQYYKPGFPITGVPLLSRQPQQTMFNEQDYTGKPDAIIRLALLSRMEHLDFNPTYSANLRSKWEKILLSRPVYAPLKEVLYKGVLALSDEDKLAIIQYSNSDAGMAWLSTLYSRADSDPKSAATIEELSKLGLDLSKFQDTSLSARRANITALYMQPNEKTRADIMKIIPWLRV